MHPTENLSNTFCRRPTSDFNSFFVADNSLTYRRSYLQLNRRHKMLFLSTLQFSLAEWPVHSPFNAAQPFYVKQFSRCSFVDHAFYKSSTTKPVVYVHASKWDLTPQTGSCSTTQLFSRPKISQISLLDFTETIIVPCEIPVHTDAPFNVHTSRPSELAGISPSVSTTTM